MAQAFRKRPVEVEAVRVSDVVAAANSNWSQLPDFVAEAYDKGKVVFLPDAILITTLEGHMRGELGDWLIKGIKGELYPCKPDIFEVTYEPVEQTVTVTTNPIKLDGRYIIDQMIGYGRGGYP